jgi:anti-sigma B factor antagonist
MSYGSAPLAVRSVDQDGVAILELSGKILGTEDAESLRDAIASAWDSGHSKLLLDFRKVPWMNSQGVGALMSLVTSMRASGRHVKLVGVNERVRSVLDVTRLSSHFEFYAGIDEAMASFGGSPRPRAS